VATFVAVIDDDGGADDGTDDDTGAAFFALVVALVSLLVGDEEGSVVGVGTAGVTVAAALMLVSKSSGSFFLSTHAPVRQSISISFSYATEMTTRGADHTHEISSICILLTTMLL
jgi:hypothetical protein